MWPCQVLLRGARVLCRAGRDLKSTLGSKMVTCKTNKYVPNQCWVVLSSNKLRLRLRFV